MSLKYLKIIIDRIPHYDVGNLLSEIPSGESHAMPLENGNFFDGMATKLIREIYFFSLVSQKSLEIYFQVNVLLTDLSQSFFADKHALANI